VPVYRFGLAWRLIAFALFALLAVSYYQYSRTEPFTHGGSTMGLIYGLAALALILLLLYYGIRKRAYRSRFGKLENWLQSHIYLGLLTLFVVLAHSGFRFEDKIATTLLIIIAVVIASGAFGAVLYKMLPRALTEVESNLSNSQMSDQLNQLGRAMARLASEKSEPFQRIYNRLERSVSPKWLAGWRLLIAGSRTGKLGDQPREIAAVLNLIPEPEQNDLRQLLVLSRQQKELYIRLLAQQRYKNLLDFWLYLHLPLSVAMIVLIAAHLWGVYYYGKLPEWLLP
jgi:hypothetical protein